MIGLIKEVSPTFVAETLVFTTHRHRSLGLGISIQIIFAKLLHKYFDGFVKPFEI